MRTLALLTLCFVIGCGQADEPAPVDEPVVAEVATFDGAWSADAMPPDSDSVLVSMRMTASDGPDGWTILFDHLDDPVEAAEVSVEGGVATVRYEPYPSALREGATVDTLITTVALAGDTFEGVYTGYYSDGVVSEGRIRAERSGDPTPSPRED